MKWIVGLFLALTLAAPAEASVRHHHMHAVHSRNFAIGLGRGLAHMVGIRLSSECRTAAALGGPCGCYASEHFFGHSVRSLWPAAAWLKFPRVSAAPGTAAIWLRGGHHRNHVASVTSVNGDGTIIVSDNIGSRRVSAHGLIFVVPR
jgi:hypothetical protein